MRDEPVFAEVISDAKTANKQGVLFVDKAGNFSFKWTGKADKSYIIARCAGGYFRFPNASGHFLDSIAGYKTIRPHHVIHSSYASVVETEKYDKLWVTFSNIFVGINQDIHRAKVVDLMEIAGLDKLKYKECDLDVYISGSAKRTEFPRTATYRQDKLIFKFSGNGSIDRGDIVEIAHKLTRAISLFTKNLATHKK